MRSAGGRETRRVRFTASPPVEIPPSESNEWVPTSASLPTATYGNRPLTDEEIEALLMNDDEAEVADASSQMEEEEFDWGEESEEEPSLSEECGVTSPEDDTHPVLRLLQPTRIDLDYASGDGLTIEVDIDSVLVSCHSLQPFSCKYSCSIETNPLLPLLVKTSSGTWTNETVSNRYANRVWRSIARRRMGRVHGSNLDSLKSTTATSSSRTQNGSHQSILQRRTPKVDERRQRTRSSVLYGLYQKHCHTRGARTSGESRDSQDGSAVPFSRRAKQLPCHKSRLSSLRQTYYRSAYRH